jgi:hypothetical protein
MKQLITLSIMLLLSTSSKAQDTTFWEHAEEYEIGKKVTIDRSWGREVVTYLGIVSWKSPSGKELEIRIVTSYQQITKANGFNDRSLLALVKPNHQLIKCYDMVKRPNLPIKIVDNMLVYKLDGAEINSALPAKISARLCVQGHTCFSEIIL